MKVFALTLTVGISSGSETLLGLFGTAEKAEATKQEHSKAHGYGEYHYDITDLELDKEVDITLAEW